MKPKDSELKFTDMAILGLRAEVYQTPGIARGGEYHARDWGMSNVVGEY